MNTNSSLITPEALSYTACRVIDASWHMPASGRNAMLEFEQAHIPGAVFFDLDAVSDVASSYPHMLPSADVFSDAMESLGISSDDLVVVYDTTGLFSAARLWWMLRVFGHKRVKVLDGGFKQWAGASESGWPKPPRGNFLAQYHPELVITREQMVDMSASRAAMILDARSAQRFRGDEPEPRPGLASGHIPGAHNLHYGALLTPEGTLKPITELRAIFDALGVSTDKPVITTCGSGVTACIIALALYELGHTHVPVYDGSWAEWGASGLPVALGA